MNSLLNSTKSTVIVRNSTYEDLKAIRDLQIKVYVGMQPYKIEQLEQQLKVFPEGQIVAELDGKIVGAASSLIISWDDFGPQHNWTEVTGKGTFTTHDKSGKTLYGAEVCVDPDMRKKGIGQKLYKARRDICKKFNLKRIIIAGRIPNYHKYADEMSPRHYIMKVLWGDIYDPVLRFQTNQGFCFCDIIKDYLKDDKQSLEYAALLVWLNQDYKEKRRKH